MNSLKMILFLLFSGILMSCHNDKMDEIEEPTEDRSKFTIEAYYNYPNSQNIKHPDVGAKVYIYFDVPTIDFMNTNYLGNGVYDKMGLITKPDQIFEVDGNGCITIERLYLDKNITIIIESNIMKPVYSFHLYSPLNPPVKITSVVTITNQH